MADLTVEPPRRRRRPALSCVPCRRRKIKCDRTIPCNHCMQSKNAVCSYKDAHPVVFKGTPGLKGPPTRLPHSDTQATPFLKANSYPRSLPSLEDGSQSEKDSWISTSGRNTEDSPSEKNVSTTCVHRARKLAELSSCADSSFSKAGDEAMSLMGINFSTFEDVLIQDGDNRNVLRTKVFKNGSSNPLHDVKGALCKTRFFGQSHWMFALKQVLL
jgi:Fungal Zn(2)-Cys(6) binuclear cluster domain